MDIAGAIHQHFHGADLAAQVPGHRLDCLGRAHVELLAHCAAQSLELVGIEIGGDDLGALGGESFGNGAADPLPGRSHERDFSLQPSGHSALP